MKNAVSAVLVAIALATAACGGSPQPTSPSAAATPLKKPGEAQIGDRTTCPISGEEFVVKADSPKAEYNGKTYYFCCPGCDKKFNADPAKFVPST